MRYHGVPGDGLRIGTNKYGERCFFSWNWPDKARQWLPMIDHPSDKATSEFVVTAPENYSVVANGLLQSEVATGDGRKVTHWKESVPIASWLNAIGVEQFAVHHAGRVRGRRAADVGGAPGPRHRRGAIRGRRPAGDRVLQRLHRPVQLREDGQRHGAVRRRRDGARERGVLR